jgi:1-acyl-sn-glycerol-3-phosphate acyltransferase
MNLVRNILGRVFALWAAIVFFVSMLVIIVPLWVISRQDEPRRTINAFKIFHPWMTFFFVFSGVRRKLVGLEWFAKEKSYVVVCNHNCFMDVPLSSCGIPVPNRTIAKAEMAKIPLFNVIYRGGSVLVDRNSELSRKKSYIQMRKVLNYGLTMCIYPEGTRNKGDVPMQPFHDGAFRLAIESKKNILPAVLIHTIKVMPRNKPFYFWPRQVEMHFLAPIASAGKTAEQLKEETFAVMEQYYVANR